MKYDIRDIRNWSATGCVEPTLSGKHIGHTNMQMMNMVAALEMAMNNGTHPLTGWKLGPETGYVETGDFKTFDEFFDGLHGAVRVSHRPVDRVQPHAGARRTSICVPRRFSRRSSTGASRKGRDVTKGGAKYNSSGTAIIGLADVTDSLMVIKKLVFDEKKISFAELKKAVDTNFEDDPALLAMVRKKVPLFGSGSDEAVAMANRVAKWVA